MCHQWCVSIPQHPNWMSGSKLDTRVLWPRLMASPASLWSPPTPHPVEKKTELVQLNSRRAGAPPPSSALGMICHSLILNAIIDYSFLRPHLFPLFFLGSSRNDFNYLHNQILIAASVKVCSHRSQGLFSLALGDRETGCFKMRTSWLHRALFNGEPLCTQTFAQVSHYAKPHISSVWSSTLY